MALEPGTKLGTFEILSLIGTGGQGEVFLAEDERLLKLLPDELQKDSVARERLQREAKSAAALDHPFICKIYEIGESEGKVFIAMEYVTGETLQERLKKGPLSLTLSSLSRPPYVGFSRTRTTTPRDKELLQTRRSTSIDAYPLKTPSWCVLNLVNRLRCPRTATAANLLSLAIPPDEF